METYHGIGSAAVDPELRGAHPFPLVVVVRFGLGRRRGVPACAPLGRLLLHDLDHCKHNHQAASGN